MNSWIYNWIYITGFRAIFNWIYCKKTGFTTGLIISIPFVGTTVCIIIFGRAVVQMAPCHDPSPEKKQKISKLILLVVNYNEYILKSNIIHLYYTKHSFNTLYSSIILTYGIALFGILFLFS